MYDEFDEKNIDEKKREAERVKRKRRKSIGLFIGIIGAVIVFSLIVFMVINYNNHLVRICSGR